MPSARWNYRSFTGAFRLATHPVGALIVHGVVVWLWHVPVLFEAAMASEAVHAVQHATFFASAALFWWSIVRGARGRLRYGVGVAFIFVTAMHTSLLGFLITIASNLWYPVYATRGQPFEVDALADQALAGLNAFLGEYKQNKLDANFPEVFIWNSIARINLENGRLEEAMKAYQKGYDSVPGSSLDETEKKIWLGRLHHGKGRTLARMGQYDAAWQEAETVKKMIAEGGERGKEFEPAYHYLAGYIELQKGDAKAAIEHLKQAGILAVFHYVPLHSSPMGLRAGAAVGDCPVAEDISRRLLRLPFYTDLTPNDQTAVIEAVHAFRV